MDEVVSAGSCSEFGHNIKEILSTDDKHRFVSFLANSSENYNRFQSCVSTILQWICSSNAINCAAALLEGETALKVNLNQPVLGGYYPLHLAARNLFPRLVELFIFHGAQTNVRCKEDVEDEDAWFFPFELGLRAASNHECLKGWASGQYAIFKLIIKLCLPEMKDAFDTIKPLVSGTLSVDALVHYYVTKGILAELAVLAMVALEEVLAIATFPIEEGCTEVGILTKFHSFEALTWSQIDCVLKLMGKDPGRKQIQTLKKEVMWTRSANLMLEIFERAGDDIEIGPWHTSDVMPFLKPIPRQTQSSPFGERSIHTSRLCKSVFISKYLTSTVDVEVKESMKAMEQRVPKLLSSEKWAYFALAIKRGIRRA